MMLGADRAGGVGRRGCCWSRSVGTLPSAGTSTCFGEEERQVARERRLHAVGPLVQEDAVAAADDGAGIVQREREAKARRQTHGARIQQAAPPPGFLGGHVRDRDQRQQRLRRGIDRAVLVARDDEAPAGHRQVDRRQPIVHVVHVLVVLVAQAEVEREVAARLPVVLGVEVEPVGPAVLVAAADAGGGRRRVPEQEVGEGIAGELPRVGEGAARVVGLLGLELQVEVVGAELQPVRAAIDREVVEQLEMLIVARREDRRIAHRVVQPAGGNLREADVARVGRHAQQADLAGEVVAAIERSAVRLRPSSSRSAPRSAASCPKTRVWLATRFRVLVVNDRPNPGTSVSWSALVPNGWSSSASNVLNRAKSWSASRQPVIEPHAELVELPVLFLDGREVLERGVRGRQRRRSAGTPPQSGRCGSPESGCSGNGVQTPVVGMVSGSQIGAEAGEIAGANGGRRHRERARQRPLHPRAFVAAEEERPVLHDRPAERAAELVLAQAAESDWPAGWK